MVPKAPIEGYVYPVYGDLKYLRHAVASATTLRRHDRTRPIALVCEPHHAAELDRLGIRLFDRIVPIAAEHRSIVGFKHHVDAYMVFDRTLFLDVDMVWCRNPDNLWKALSAYPFTITGQVTADSFFGGPKGFGVLRDILLGRRARTLRRFGLTYLSRVQSGMMYAADAALTREVCATAGDMLARKCDTHFQSRTMESGRTEESCEWSLAMAMSKLDVPVHPWHHGQESPQLDFIQDLTEYDPEFERVVCTYYCDPFVFSLRGLKHDGIRRFLIGFLRLFPGVGDSMRVTPYVLHFGWLHQKQPFYAFSERVWAKVNTAKPLAPGS